MLIAPIKIVVTLNDVIMQPGIPAELRILNDLFFEFLSYVLKFKNAR